MLGTFSLEPYVKSYCLFTFGSLEILEIAKQSIFFHLRPTPLLALPPACRRAARRSGPPPRATSYSCWLPRVARKLPTALCHRAVPLLALPRTPAEPSGRHLAVAVASSLQSPGPRFLSRSRTTSTPESFSPRSFAISPLPEHRMPPPLHPERRRAQAAVDPPHCSFSARANPSISFASSPRS